MAEPSISLIIPALGCIDLDEMLASLRENRFEVIVCIDWIGRAYLPEDKKANLDTLKAKYRSVIWCDNFGNPTWDQVNQTLNIAFAKSTGDWIWITHEDILFPDCHSSQQHYRYDLRLKTAIRENEDPNLKCLMFHYYQIPNKLDTRMSTVNDTNGYHSGYGNGGYTPVASVVHRSVIEGMGGFDTEYGVYYDCLIAYDSTLKHWNSKCIQDAPSIIHKVSLGGKYTNNCNDFEKIKKWGQIEASNRKWREHVGLPV